MKKATRYIREIYRSCNVRLVNIGKNGQTTCTSLPDTKQELEGSIRLNTHTKVDQPFERGSGDQYILDNPNCVVRYYDSVTKKLLRTLR